MFQTQSYPDVKKAPGPFSTMANRIFGQRLQNMPILHDGAMDLTVNSM